MSNTSIKPFFFTAYCSKKCLLEVETVRYQCQSYDAEMSWVRSVLGPECLDTTNATTKYRYEYDTLN